MLDYYEPLQPADQWEPEPVEPDPACDMLAGLAGYDCCDVATVRQVAEAATGSVEAHTRQTHHAIRGALSEALAWFVAACEEADGAGWR